MSSEAWHGPALQMRHVSHCFGSGPNARKVLHNIDLTVAAGEFVMLMGPSGCGKTTVLTLAGGLRSVQTGSLRSLGVELRGADEGTRVALRRQIGFVYQTHNLHGSLTALENIRMALEVHGPERLRHWRDACFVALVSVGLENRADAYPAQLSTGQKQRVAIARAVATRPKLLLTDEPTAALDRTNGRQVIGLLRRLAREHGSAVLMVTHDNRILDIADRIVEMDDGRLAAANSSSSQGSLEKVRHSLTPHD